MVMLELLITLYDSYAPVTVYRWEMLLMKVSDKGNNDGMYQYPEGNTVNIPPTENNYYLHQVGISSNTC